MVINNDMNMLSALDFYFTKLIFICSTLSIRLFHWILAMLLITMKSYWNWDLFWDNNYQAVQIVDQLMIQRS